MHAKHKYVLAKFKTLEYIPWIGGRLVVAAVLTMLKFLVVFLAKQ